jgi:type IV pilus assembly protein PilX
MKLSSQKTTRQQGAVLIVSLIILLIMTLIGLSSMQNTTLEEKMAGNYRDKNLSFQAAEMTLREGEGWLAEQIKEPELSTDSCSSNCDVWDSDTLLAALSSSSYLDNTLWSDGRARTATITIPEVAASPEYFLEFELDKRDRLNIGQQQDSTVRIYYGVVAQGVGGSVSTKTVLQSIYTRRF